MVTRPSRSSNVQVTIRKCLSLPPSKKQAACKQACSWKSGLINPLNECMSYVTTPVGTVKCRLSPHIMNFEVHSFELISITLYEYKPMSCEVFCNFVRFHGEELLASRPTPSRSTTPCQLTANAHILTSCGPVSFSRRTLFHLVS